MSRRTERLASVIRNTVAQAVHGKLSDPRINPARTSITRVEIPEDLLTAKVFVSVIGTESEHRTVIRALQHAAGRLQQMIAGKVRLRNTPRLSFEIDEQFKRTQQALELIQQAMEEIRDKEQNDTETETPNGSPAEGTDKSISQPTN